MRTCNGRTMAASLDLVQRLWNIPDASDGCALASLPVGMQDKSLLILAAQDGLIEFGSQESDKDSGTKRWLRADFAHTTYSEFVKEAKADSGKRVRLTAKGETAACRSLPSKAPSREAINAQDNKQKPFCKYRFNGSDRWNNWACGVDRNGIWHLFHISTPTRIYSNIRWVHHAQRRIAIASGRMEEMASTFAFLGVYEADRAAVKELKFTVSRLRKVIADAVIAEGFFVRSNPIPYRRSLGAWCPAVGFGEAATNGQRQWVFTRGGI